nr:MAG TPA: hypothetical protein [Bacteriophage sp.]
MLIFYLFHVEQFVLFSLFLSHTTKVSVLF